ncbi:MAG TPA: MerR family transcriptional regulator [Mycobacteriales bacterium]|jgi:DNA-binding transcriptional MerR regulator|nr:MerR family transcriptional regulator [Mycobacteriales bacterium]
MPPVRAAADGDGSGPLPVAAVARRLGVAPATLRTWDRRYGVGPSAHAPGAHRRYSPADVARLETMRRLTLDGVPPAEAARAALAQHAPTDADEGPARPEQRPLPDREGRLRRGGPGGRVLALPGAGDVAIGLGRAAMALDSTAVMTSLRAELAEHGVVHTWDHVLRPVLAAAGARWAATGEGVEVEHLLSECVTAALREVAGSSGVRPAARPVLLASAPQEQHALPLHAVAAGLAERGVGSQVLGGALPADALQAAVRRTGAAALFVWSQLDSTGAPEALAGVPVTRPPTALVVGGPGWHLEALPDRVAVARDLSDAVDLVQQATGA